jgi:hypothetical protein
MVSQWYRQERDMQDDFGTSYSVYPTFPCPDRRRRPAIVETAAAA